MSFFCVSIVNNRWVIGRKARDKTGNSRNADILFKIWQSVKQILNITTTDPTTYMVQLLEKLATK